jgi:organic radical activating enzyme
MKTSPDVKTMQSDIEKIARRMRTKINCAIDALKYNNPFSHYRRLADEDAKSFSEVLNIWKPRDAPNAILVRWHVTEWCNYNCPYCPQTHGRYQPKGNSFTAHAFDNFPLDQWLQAFRRHFSGCRLSLVLSGGEVLLDRKNMSLLLTAFHEMAEVEWLRIDTNVSWKLDCYKEIDKSKILLMCTYHPSQVDEQQFFEKIQRFLEGGFQIGMINYVMTPQQREQYFVCKEKFRKLGIPLHPNPLWGKSGRHSAEDMELFESELPSLDYLYRTGISSPKGKKCLFPGIAYELDYRGNIKVGCHRGVSGSFFDHDLPSLFAGPVPCPYSRCACLDKYSFLEGSNRNTTTNPLKSYSRALLERSSTEPTTHQGKTR